jgi:mutator protein MutT
MTDDVVRVVAGLVERGQKLLVCRRPRNKRYGGLWEFPGGKCRSGESLEAAISRELDEELGVEVIMVGEPEFIAQDRDSPHMLFFVPVSIEREPVCREHTELRWVSFRELKDIPLAPCDGLYREHMAREKRDPGG